MTTIIEVSAKKSDAFACKGRTGILFLEVMIQHRLRLFLLQDNVCLKKTECRNICCFRDYEVDSITDVMIELNSCGICLVVVRG